MKVGYVVLYVNDPAASLLFWLDKFGMVEKDRKEVAHFAIVRVGFVDQDFSFELVPLELMQNNPEGLNLDAPSIAFYVSNLEITRNELTEKGVQCSEIGEHSGITSFAFSDNEGRWFAILQS